MKTTITTVSSTVYQETSSATPPAISLSPITKTDDEDLLFLNSLVCYIDSKIVIQFKYENFKTKFIST